MSDLSEAQHQIACLDAQVRQCCAGAANDALHDVLELSARIALLAGHPDLGVGEARAALQEAAEVLLYLGRPICKAGA